MESLFDRAAACLAAKLKGTASSNFRGLMRHIQFGFVIHAGTGYKFIKKKSPQSGVFDCPTLGSITC